MPPGRPSKEGAPRKPNPLRNRPPIKAPLPPIFQQKQAAAAAAAAKAPPRPARRACPNKTCSAPDVVDGVCHNCGTIVDDSNIVSEVQFGESSNGAAVVQGSFVSADQGTAKSLGPAFRRAGGMEDRESTIREGKRASPPFLYSVLTSLRPTHYASISRPACDPRVDYHERSPNIQTCCKQQLHPRSSHGHGRCCLPLFCCSQGVAL
jgi:hypothetical protein